MLRSPCNLRRGLLCLLLVSIPETQRRHGEIRCSEPAHAKRMRIPSPLVAGRPGCGYLLEERTVRNVIE